MDCRLQPKLCVHSQATHACQTVFIYTLLFVTLTEYHLRRRIHLECKPCLILQLLYQMICCWLTTNHLHYYATENI